MSAPNMTSPPPNPQRVWLCCCLAFVAAGCLLLCSALGNDPYRLFLVAGVLQWIAGLIWLFRLRTRTARRDERAG